jgi:hypothetical protein
MERPNILGWLAALRERDDAQVRAVAEAREVLADIIGHVWNGQEVDPREWGE